MQHTYWKVWVKVTSLSLMTHSTRKTFLELEFSTCENTQIWDVPKAVFFFYWLRRSFEEGSVCIWLAHPQGQVGHPSLWSALVRHMEQNTTCILPVHTCLYTCVAFSFYMCCPNAHNDYDTAKACIQVSGAQHLPWMRFYCPAWENRDQCIEEEIAILLKYKMSHVATLAHKHYPVHAALIKHLWNEQNLHTYKNVLSWSPATDVRITDWGNG